MALIMRSSYEISSLESNHVEPPSLFLTAMRDHMTMLAEFAAERKRLKNYFVGSKVKK
ncbi:MAG TPA: hypothetical protein VIK35_05760 [Verrucomicrobiae bacterium]